MIMDITGFTSSQLRELIQQASELISIKIEEESEAKQLRLSRIEAAKSTLATLLGPEDAEPSPSSIRGVQAYSDEVIEENPVVAFRLILEGLEILTKVTLDVTHLLNE